jgi:Proline dehydrogenase
MPGIEHIGALWKPRPPELLLWPAGVKLTSLPASEQCWCCSLLPAVRMQSQGYDVGGLQAGVRLLIDAEQSYLQPAIDFFTLELQRQYNAQQPVVYNTFQAYRTDTRERYGACFCDSVHCSYVQLGC